MKKIMFNDRYGLTKAVLDGRKTMTRRAIPKITIDRANDYVQKVYGSGHDMLDYLIEHPGYKVGEVVAVAQALWDMGYDPRDTKHRSGAIWGLDHTPAWTNKMFVSVSECIHQIRITNVRVERLQDITDEDCLKEGVFLGQFHTYSYVHRPRCPFNTPRSAFASLIDKISGKGTWEKNPWVYVYEFGLLK